VHNLADYSSGLYELHQEYRVFRFSVTSLNVADISPGHRIGS